MSIEKKHQIIEQHLLDIVHKFLMDLDAQRALQKISLNASLESDLGIDSIGKVELFSRIEKNFQFICLSVL
ncbi:acyl carrier protein [Legionella longbeachae]|uniref:acyl carrier protein n=1 Tax=Legionella longbeachae TaxID=450 RepID=UPI0002EBEF65|nr:phosphopantetheine-binding protein [Legionella longbeachae]VEE03845.1 Uncharacterised protein [Legionella oakridgensis]HBD7397372.1 hypothetical protein [Legionella pneumophila]ARB93294.1 hypothetical protein A6J40_14410 [Legionella longbeachae]ARM33642.1 hypothetical protein B0B39_08930 [Legionella longbeachae]QIN33513.1 hypothetical protein GCB94_15840 [Legionella longbeachae]